jgi:glycosyltransferase involved in cell wall biosynthesis
VSHVAPPRADEPRVPVPAAALGPGGVSASAALDDRGTGPASPRLRVVHVIDSLAGSGGAENRLVDEVVLLRDRFDQTVVRLFADDFLDGRLADAGIPVVALGFSAATAGRTWPLAARRLTRVLADVGPDVVHTSLFAGNLVGQIAAARLGLPVVSTFNRSGERDVLRTLVPGGATWKVRSMQALGRRVARRGDVHYRAVGSYALETNCTAMGLPVAAASVIERGIAVDDTAPEAAGLAGDARVGPRDGRRVLPTGTPLFVNAARLVPEKAQHLLVDAFAIVHAQLPDAHLAIAGAPGAAAARVREAIARAGLGDAVSLLGFRDDVRALVAAADVFAFSSMSEGSPGAVVEALVLGTPVAAFGIAPVAELTDGDRHAWLAEPGDPRSLADAMLAAWRAPDRKERAAASRAWARQRYSLASVAGRLGDLLEARARAAQAPPGNDQRMSRRGRRRRPR